MSVLDISKTLMYEFWYDYINLKYQGRAKLCYMDTESNVIHIKTEDFYEDIAADVEKWFDTWNNSEDDNRPLLIDWNEKIISLFKDELSGKIIKEFVGLRAKAWAYLMDDGSEHKKSWRSKKKCNKKRTYV